MEVPTQSSLPSCLICFNEFDPKSSPFAEIPHFACSHFQNSICIACADSWFQINISKVNAKHETDSFVRCPIENCDQGVSLNNSFDCISLANFPKSEEQLFQNYLQQPYDIVRCPAQSCGYYGIHPDVSCKNDLICELCNHHWKEQENNDDDNGILKNLFCLDSIELQTQIFKYFNTKKCPTCLALIEKNGGSQTVICTRCDSLFCWDCLNTITSKKEHSLKCNFRLIAIFLIYFFFPFVYVLKKVSIIGVVSAMVLLTRVGDWIKQSYLALRNTKSIFLTLIEYLFTVSLCTASISQKILKRFLKTTENQ